MTFVGRILVIVIMAFSLIFRGLHRGLHDREELEGGDGSPEEEGRRSSEKGPRPAGSIDASKKDLPPPRPVTIPEKGA